MKDLACKTLHKTSELDQSKRDQPGDLKPSPNQANIWYWSCFPDIPGQNSRPPANLVADKLAQTVLDLKP